MADFPLATLAAVVDATGISAPSYADTLSSLQASVQQIYGDDIYIDPDSPDGQFLAVLALAIRDANDAAIAAYNSFSPTTAQGTGLSSLVKINGLRRLVPTSSQVAVTLSGDPGTVISSGVVGDGLGLGTQWALPATVTLDNLGSATVTAVCTVPGDTLAAPGTITVILTPEAGWLTVTNPSSATPGAPVESDATLRRRQAGSTATPAQSIREATYGAVANVTGVTRLQVFENDTAATDSNGIPSHSIAVVAEGGDATAIATAIASRKPPGTGTYGTVSEVIIDSHGVPDDISFFELSDAQISVLVQINPLSGYLSTTAALIQQAIQYYLNNAEIGATGYWSRLGAPADLKGTAATSATGQTQAQLDALSATYDVLAAVGIAQARADTLITGGPYLTGATAMTISSNADFAAGKVGFALMDNGVPFQFTVTSVVGSTVNFTPAVPVGRNVPNGLAYVVGDVHVAFNEATACAATTQVEVIAL